MTQSDNAQSTHDDAQVRTSLDAPGGDLAYSLGYPPEPPFSPSSWSFDQRVTAQFDQMLARSIPQYAVMRRACFDVGASFVDPGTDIVDLGCSRGEAVAPFVDFFGAHNRFVLCETSEPMRAAAAERFKGWLDREQHRHYTLMRLEATDLRHGYPRLIMGTASLTLCILTLQFTPIEYRRQIVQRIFDTTMPGGALLLVEKVTGENARTDDLLTKNYLKYKSEQGYTEEEIARKRSALEGVLVPLSARWNEDMLKAAGFSAVECFWRWMNFVGWVAVR
jgi:tRNA (cmo5U34)-methyltransferase